MGRRPIMLLLALVALISAACSASVLSLDVGECFDDPETFVEVTDVETVDCSTPHDNEVFGVHQLPDRAWPGDDAVAESADSACLDLFGGYVGVPYESSPYETGWLSPTAESWDSGDREVICFLYLPSLEKITGSVSGTRA